MRSSARKDLDIRGALCREVGDLRAGTAELTLHFSRNQFQQFKAYLRILHDARGNVHLISNQDYTRIARRHVLPSLMAFPLLQGRRVCDVGTGAGFPGIPLAIADPGLHIVLAESVKKKVVFLENVKHALGLDALTIIHDRAEHYQGERFDTIVLRAVGTIKKNLKTIDLLLAPGGRAIFFKTHVVKRELKQAQPLMARLGFTAQVHTRYTPLEQRPLAFVVLERT